MALVADGCDRRRAMPTTSLSRPEEARRKARGRLRLRPRVWLRAMELDEQLAFGWPRWWSDAHELRGSQLASMRRRRSMARSIRAVVAECRADPPICSPCVPLRRRQVQAAADALEEVAIALTCAGPPSARGLALVECLMTHATSPLYMAGERTVRDAALEAAVVLYVERPPAR